MTIKELEEFQMICQRGSLAKASKDLFMSPQGLSRVLKNLENELDCILLNRGAAGIELTESGKCLLEYANIVLKEYAVLKKEIEMIQNSATGTLELLMAYDVIRFLTPDCIIEFQKSYPNVTFSYLEYPDRIVEKKLLEKDGNAALSVGPFTGDCFQVRPLFSCKLGLLVYEDHPLAENKVVTIDDLEHEQIYLQNSSFKINEFIQSKCWNKGFEPNIIFETMDFDLCYKMCRMKRGISITVDFIHEDMKTDGLVMIPFEEEDMVWEIGFLTGKEQSEESTVNYFYEFVENYINKMLIGGNKERKGR